jgi:hypothetical protein
MASVAVVPSPLRCQWIQSGTELHVINGISDGTYALCVRVPEHPRVVSEDECADCPRWEASERTDAIGNQG